MKKMKFAVLLAALASVFSFSSCLDSGEDGPQQYLSLVTVRDYMGFTRLIPDESPKQVLVPTAADLSKYGITPGTERALVSYTILEGQDLANVKEVQVSLISARPWKVEHVSLMPDTCKDYKSSLYKFSQYGVGFWSFPSINVVQNRFLNLGYIYRADKTGKVCMLPNRASNDTIYLDFKLKKEGNAYTSPVQMTTYDMNCPAIFQLKNKVTPVQDSIYVTVVAAVSEWGDQDTRKDSVTVRCGMY